jgi:hypothetical protein
MKRKDGKLDRRSTEYKEAVARMATARKALKSERSATTENRRADGQLDQRTTEGKAMAAKMAELRARRGKSKGFFAWLFK